VISPLRAAVAAGLLIRYSTVIVIRRRRRYDSRETAMQDENLDDRTFSGRQSALGVPPLHRCHWPINHSIILSPRAADCMRFHRVLSQLPALPHNDLRCSGTVLGSYSGFREGRYRKTKAYHVISNNRIKQ